MAHEMASWSNISITLRESWFAIVAIIIYLCLAEYNKRLDADEMRIVQAAAEEEKQYEVDDSETSSQDSGHSSSSLSEL